MSPWAKARPSAILRAPPFYRPLAKLAILISMRSSFPTLSWVDGALGGAVQVPHARGGGAAASWHLASKDVLYLFGGCSEVTCFNDLARHDKHSQRWAVQQARGKAPSRRKGHSLTLLGPTGAQQLLVFGGWGSDSPVPNSLKAFELQTDTWEVLMTSGSPPSARWAHTATAIEQSRMIIVGGEGQLPGQYLNDVYAFDLTDHQWTRLHPRGDGSSGRLLPSPRMGHSATLVGEVVLLFGGYTSERRGARAYRVATNDLWVSCRSERSRINPLCSFLPERCCTRDAHDAPC